MNRLSHAWRATPILVALALLLATSSFSFAQDRPSRPPPPPPAPQPNQLVIGYVQLDNDPRYEPIREYTRIVLKTPEHPYAGAEVGIDDARPLARVLKTDFSLERISVAAPQDAAEAVLAAARDKGISFFLLDLPAAAFQPLADAVRGRDVLLFNVSAPEDSLRRDLCASEFVHTMPSLAMETDALVQYLVSKKWRDILVFEGPGEGDAAMAKSFAHSVTKFGARIVASKPFKPGSDPREREQNDPALMSAVGRDYDVVFVADEAFDFVRSVPFHTVRPRPVIGSIALEPDAWHWTWDHNGAPQVNARFATHSGGRHMEGADWAAWIAVKMVVQAVLHTRANAFGPLRDFILKDGSFDGDKGLAVSVRPWDHQLRQAVLLVSDYAVVASAPIEGFLHQTNELDTLGDDQPESPCHLNR